MENQFLEKELPVNDLEKLGLYQGGKLTLERDDLDALLSGRRTDLIRLNELQSEGFRIESLDAKISLERSLDGKITVQIHPIYKEAQKHPLLIDVEADQLELGALSSVIKTYQTPEGKKKSWVIEYDQETKEFLSYDPDKVKVPDAVNGEKLSDIQKELFRNGGLVQLPDGTLLQHRASDRKGILSDRATLVLSVLLDGGISYLIIRGLRNILNNPKEQKDEYSEAYNRVIQEMERQRVNNLPPDPEQQNNHKAQHNRGYGRNTSR
ncbi:MAG: DUF4099 domain-containing protein [Bacteroidota bacterium]